VALFLRGVRGGGFPPPHARGLLSSGGAARPFYPLHPPHSGRPPSFFSFGCIFLCGLCPGGPDGRRRAAAPASERFFVQGRPRAPSVAGAAGRRCALKDGGAGGFFSVFAGERSPIFGLIRRPGAPVRFLKRCCRAPGGKTGAPRGGKKIKPPGARVKQFFPFDKPAPFYILSRGGGGEHTRRGPGV